MTTQATTEYAMRNKTNSYDIKRKKLAASTYTENGSAISSSLGTTTTTTQAAQNRIRRLQNENGASSDFVKPQHSLKTRHAVKLPSKTDALSPTTQLIQSRAEQAKYMSTSDIPSQGLHHTSFPQHDNTFESNSHPRQTTERRDPFQPDLDGTENDSDHDRSFFMKDAFASHNTNTPSRMTRRQKLTQDRTQRKRTNRQPKEQEQVVVPDENDAGAAVNNVRGPMAAHSSVSATPVAAQAEYSQKGPLPAFKEKLHQPKTVFRRPSPVNYRITRLTQSTSSSSDTDAKGGSYEDPQMLLLRNPTRSELSASAITPDVAAFFHQQQSSSRSGRSDTYDEEDIDDSNSQASLSYQQRLAREEMEMKARKEAVDAAKAEMRSHKFMQKEDVENYRKKLETPVAKTVAIVSAAAFVGCVVLGPVGLLVGAAAVGIGAGAMQIPEEQRNNMMKSAQESVISAGDAISHSCMNTYKDSGIAEHVPADIQSCCATMDVETDELLPISASVIVTTENDESIQGSRSKTADQSSPVAPTVREKNKNGRVACLREGEIVVRVLSFLSGSIIN